jgi:hypothetical protein
MKKFLFGCFFALSIMSAQAMEQEDLTCKEKSKASDDPIECSWDNLPHEIKLYILSFIASPSGYKLKQLRELALVSKDFKQIVDTPSLQSSLVKEFGKKWPAKLEVLLRYALYKKNVSLVAILLEAELDLNTMSISRRSSALPPFKPYDYKGATLLSIALESGSKKCISLLAKHGACINIVPTELKQSFKERLSILEKKCLYLGPFDQSWNKHLEIEHFKEPKPLLNQAVDQSKKNMVELLLSLGADPNLTDALHVAIESNNSEIAQLLISNGADINKKGTYYYRNCTPLMVAVLDSKPQMKQFLLEQGANPDDIQKAERIAEKNRRFSESQSLIEEFPTRP